jgi:transketolase
MESLAPLAARVRGHVLRMSARAQTAHLASALSVVDILVAAYAGTTFRLGVGDVPRDTLILSKGHAVSALYAILAETGAIPLAELDRYNEPGGRLPEQPSPGCAPGVEWATGSLGHGLPVGLGMALADRIQGSDRRVCVVMSDGECNEGSVWEAAMMAAAQKTNRLIAVVDANGWQATGRSAEVLALEPLREKWEAFGWIAREVDGHDTAALCRAFALCHAETAGPSILIARTTKGKGVSFMQDDNNWHYRSPTPDELVRALRELGLS